MPWIKVLVGIHTQQGKTYYPGDVFFSPNEHFLYHHGTDKYTEVDPPVETPVVEEVEEEELIAEQALTTANKRNKRRR